MKREETVKKASQKEAEIHRKALRRRNKLAFSEDTCLEKKIVRLEVIQKKLW